jgi:hypothetical protein
MAQSTSLHDVIAEFGARRVLFTALFVLLRPRPMATLPELDDHLRRDMGLPPRAASPPQLPQSLRHFW